MGAASTRMGPTGVRTLSAGGPARPDTIFDRANEGRAGAWPMNPQPSKFSRVMNTPAPPPNRGEGGNLLRKITGLGRPGLRCCGILRPCSDEH